MKKNNMVSVIMMKRTFKVAIPPKRELRETCLDCVMKHVTAARALSLEICQGYPAHYFFALGHLSEAADECVKRYPGLAVFIRDQRLQWTADAAKIPDWRLMVTVIYRLIVAEGLRPAKIEITDAMVKKFNDGLRRACGEKQRPA